MYFIYGKPGCSYCVRAKKLLERNGKEYDYIDITADEDAWNFVKHELGASTVPQVFDRLTYIGGFTELQEYIQ